MSSVTIALGLMALIWSVVLLPQALRSWSSSPRTTVGGFERTMEALGTEGVTNMRLATPQPSSVRRRENPLIVKRRVRFMRMLFSLGLTTLAAIWFGGYVWLLFVATAAATGAYATILRRLKVQRDEAREVVRELHLHPPDQRRIEPGNLGRAAVGAEGYSDGWSSTTVRLRRWDD